MLRSVQRFHEELGRSRPGEDGRMAGWSTSPIHDINLYLTGASSRTQEGVVAPPAGEVFSFGPDILRSQTMTLYLRVLIH